MDETLETMIREFEEDRPMTDPDNGLVLQLRKMIKESLKENAKLRKKLREQEQDILDKIRAEIESQREEASKKYSEDAGLTNYYFGLNDGLKDARDILDKYR